MAALYGALLMLLPLASAALPTFTCDDVIKPLHRDQLDKVLGSWVLVGAASDQDNKLLSPLASSRLEFSLSADNTSFIYHEMNRFSNASCVWYSIVGNVTESEKLTVDIHSVLREEAGVVTSIHGYYGQMFLYQNCPTCQDFHLSVLYKPALNSTESRFTLNYRRPPLQGDDSLQGVALNTRQQAECLQMTELTGEFTYDGASEFCPDKVVVPVAAEEKPDH